MPFAASSATALILPSASYPVPFAGILSNARSPSLIRITAGAVCTSTTRSRASANVRAVPGPLRRASAAGPSSPRSTTPRRHDRRRGRTIGRRSCRLHGPDTPFLAPYMRVGGVAGRFVGHPTPPRACGSFIWRLAPSAASPWPRSGVRSGDRSRHAFPPGPSLAHHRSPAAVRVRATPSTSA